MTTTTERTIVNPSIKDKITFIEMAAETNGSYTLLELEVGPGGGMLMAWPRTGAAQKENKSPKTYTIWRYW